MSSFFLFKIISKIVSSSHAALAVFFFSLSPLSILTSRSFQPDQMMLAFSLGAIYFACISSSINKRFILFSAIFASFAILTKAHAAVFTLIPAFFLLSQNFKKSLLRWSVVYLTISMTPSIIWYAYTFFEKNSRMSTQTNFELSNWFSFNVFLNPSYYSNVFGFESNLVLLPVGIFLFAIGFFYKDWRRYLFLYIWLASIFVYFFLFII